MPKPAQKKAPDSILGRVKESLSEIAKPYGGKGGRLRRENIDSQLEEAELGKRRSRQSTDDSN